MYDPKQTGELIKLESKKKDKSVLQVLSECGVNRNAVSSMTTRGSWISPDSLALIADYLGVSVDYLLGRTVSEETLTEDERKLISALRSHPEMKQAVLKLLD